MKNMISKEPVHPSPASLARERLASPVDLRIEELARRERAAVARGDWAAARACVVERADLRETHQRVTARRRA